MNLSAKSDVLDEVDRVDFFPVSDPSEGLFVGLGIHDVLVCWWLRRDDRPDLYKVRRFNRPVNRLRDLFHPPRTTSNNSAISSVVVGAYSRPSTVATSARSPRSGEHFAPNSVS